MFKFVMIKIAKQFRSWWPKGREYSPDSLLRWRSATAIEEAKLKNGIIIKLNNSLFEIMKNLLIAFKRWFCVILNFCGWY